MPRNKLAPEPRNSLWSAAKQYVGDVAPGGSLNPEWTPERVEALLSLIAHSLRAQLAAPLPAHPVSPDLLPHTT